MRQKRNEYMRTYMLRRYYQRRKTALIKLGNFCWECYSQENLEIDHIDREDKDFPIGEALSTWAQSKIDDELKKCQLLCKDCHTFKSSMEANKIPTKGRNIHGTLSAYKYCKCIECKAAKSRSNKQQRASSLKDKQEALNFPL